MFLASVQTDQFGHQEFFQLLEQYVDIFKSIYQSGNMNYFANFFNIEMEGLDIQTLFQRCVKRYIHMFDVYNQNGDIPLRDA